MTKRDTLLLTFVAVVSLLFCSSFSSLTVPAKSALTAAQPPPLLVQFVHKPRPQDLRLLLTHPHVRGVEKLTPLSTEFFDRLYVVKLKVASSTEGDPSREKALSLEEEAVIQQEIANLVQSTSPIEHMEFSQRIASVFALQSGNQAQNPTNDPYVNFQWALQDSGQVILRDFTDISSDSISKPAANPPGDVGLPNNIDTQMQNNVLVAVLDSGVDLSHPDLIHNLYHNTKECLSDGSIPVNPTVDQDQNGFVGDCMGWNFVADQGPGDNRPDDDLGHGTHVAGILAAERNNGLGVSGLSNRIQILPVRIYWAEESPTKKKSFTLTERIIKGVAYAMLMHAKVINFSMGWPTSVDSPLLRQTFADAISSGVTIVAAAGNNSTSTPVFPCAYPGVICVGATSLDGQLAPFTNFGSHVDLGAPGEEILSTYPRVIPSQNVPPAAFFSDPNYEILSGTSMSAPYVSGAVAILKGLNPNISENEVKGRLFASSQKILPSTLSGDFATASLRFGALKIGQAIGLAPQAVIAPDFKGLDRVTFSTTNLKVALNIPIVSYWTESPGVTVTVTSLAPQLQLVSGQQLHTDFKGNGDSHVLPVVGQLTDLNQSSQMKIQIAVAVPGQPLQVYTHDFEASRSLVNDSQVARWPLVFQTAPKSLGLLSLNRLNPGDAPEFFWTDSPLPGHTDKPQFHILRNDGQGYTQLDLPFVSANQGLSLQRTPVYQPGSAAYFQGEIVQPPGDAKRYILYHAIAQNMTLAPEPSAIQFVPETVAVDAGGLASLNYLPLQISTGTTLPLMVFQTEGRIPKADQDPNLLHFADNSARLGVFFLEPRANNGVWSMTTRLFDNFQFASNFRQKLQLSDLTTVTVLRLLPQNEDKTKIRALVSFGESSQKNYVLIQVRTDQLLAHNFDILPVSNLASSEVDQAQFVNVHSLQPGLPDQFGFFAPVSPKRADLFFLSADFTQLQMRQTASPSFRYDNILGDIGAFFDGSVYYSFLETSAHLILQISQKNAPAKHFETNIHRNSIFPGQSFTETFSLLHYTDKAGGLHPALYTDATQISSSHVSVLVADRDKGLIAPLGLNVDVPPGCATLAPQNIVSSGPDNIVLICRTQMGFELRALPVSE